MPAPRFLPPLELNADLHEALVRLNARHRISRSEDLRLKIILHQHRIAVNLLSSARHLGCHRHTVRTWHLRASEASQRWEEDVKHAMETPGHAGVSLIKERLAREVLADEPRSGRSPTYTPEQYTQIVAIAVRLPSEFNRPITHWTARELADEVHLQEIAPISARQVQRFLQTADLKPHRSRYWLNPKIQNS